MIRSPLSESSLFLPEAGAVRTMAILGVRLFSGGLMYRGGEPLDALLL